MDKILLFLLAFSLSIVMDAQTFTDDFESYDDGAQVGASSSTWTTWSGGTADDAPITTEQAHSGTKSLKIKGASANGGPADVVLPFPGKLTSGSFDFAFFIYVKAGSNAYLNLQGEVNIGDKWAEDFYFNSSGTLTGTNFPFVGSYNQDQWVEFKLNIDLDHNIWKIFLDDVYQGSYSNPVNSIASMDIYPTSGISDFYMDDVSYTYNAATPSLSTLNATLNSIERRSRYLVGYVPNFGAIVRNTGTDTITSFDVSINDNGGFGVQAITGLNIASLEEYVVDLSDLASNIAQGTNYISVAISNINGGEDSILVDNNLNAVSTGIAPAPNKKVLFEEGTGTWCQWCPRGAVFMDRMAERYPDHFVGIAVHSGDPMEVPNYASSVGFSSYPSMSTDRNSIFNFGVLGDLDLRFFIGVVHTTPAAIFSGAKYNNATKSLTISAQADFMEDASEQYKLSVILTENGVTGTSSQYAQKNAYAGGGNGLMGGYENLPSVVPAAQMVYDHVGRALISPFDGATNSIPLNAVNGESYVYEMPAYTIPDNFDTDNLHVITLLIDESGDVVNVNSQTFNETLETVVGENFVDTQQDLMEVYPNPFNGQSNVFLSLTSPSKVDMNVINSIGQVIASEHYGYLSEKTNLPFDASQLDKGIYFIQLKLENRIITQRIVIQ